MNGDVALVVDVDGTLVGGDLLAEGMARLLAKSPLRLFALPIWAVRGRAGLKREVAERAPLPVDELVLNTLVVDEIDAAKAEGREVWLATGSDALAVAPLADKLGATGVLASDGRTNLTGRAKAEALVEHFGERGFDYVGNEWRDLAVWEHARCAIGVDLSDSLARRLHGTGEATRLLAGFGGGWRDYFQSWRPHHWVKNLLVFAPLVAAHVTSPTVYALAAGVFLALCACASATYLLNDVLDMPHDRRHPNKRQRALAAGRVSPWVALATSVALAVGGVGLAFSLSSSAGAWTLAYLGLSWCYALALRRRVVADVVALAVLHGIRALAGAAAAAVVPSPWFLAFFLFVFLALAVAKRQQELATRDEEAAFAVGDRGYGGGDRSVLAAFGAASGIASIVVLAIYLQSADVNALYAQPEYLWPICPLLLWWLGRLGVLANRGAIADDPVVFAAKDPAGWMLGAAAVVVFVAAL